jgi:hypothetical protein
VKVKKKNLLFLEGEYEKLQIEICDLGKGGIPRQAGSDSWL